MELRVIGYNIIFTTNFIGLIIKVVLIKVYIYQLSYGYRNQNIQFFKIKNVIFQQY